MMRIKGHFWIC